MLILSTYKSYKKKKQKIPISSLSFFNVDIDFIIPKILFRFPRPFRKICETKKNGIGTMILNVGINNEKFIKKKYKHKSRAVYYFANRIEE